MAKKSGRTLPVGVFPADDGYEAKALTETGFVCLGTYRTIRAAVAARAKYWAKKKDSQRLPASLDGLSPFELARKIPVAEAAKHAGVHVDTFKRAYGHLLKRVGRRRLMVTVRDAILLPSDTD